MSQRTHFTGLTACLLFGLVIGWLVHGGTSPPAASDGPGSKSDRRTGRDVRPAPSAGIASRVGRVAGLDDISDRMKGAYAMAMAVPLDRIEEWLAGDYFDTPDSRVDSFFYQILYDRWLDADPEAFLTRCVHKNYDSVLVKRYMREWARRDLDAARAFMMDLPDRRDFQQIASHVLAEMARTRPEAAVALIHELLGSRNIESHILREALKSLTTKEPDGMLATAREWPPSLEELVLRQAAGVKLREDFLGAVQWMQEQRGAAGRELLNEAISDNPKLAKEFLQVARHLPEGWAGAIINQESWQLAQADPEAILALRPEDLGLKEGGLNNLRTHALQHLVDKDWNQAETMLHHAPGLSTRDRQNLAAQLARRLARTDPVKAAAWASAIADPGMRQSAEEAAKPQQSDTRPSNTLTPRSLLDAALARGPSMSFYSARHWPRRATREAVDGFNELGPEDRTKAAKRLLSSRHYLPLELQAAILNHQITADPPPPQEHQSPFSLPTADLAGDIAHNWADWEPAAAARWVTSLPAGPERDQATKALLQSWRLQAPSEANRWAKRHTPE